METGGGEDGAHIYRVRVFYEDTDAGGIVYHANYLKFAERARTEFLRTLGIGQRHLRAVHDVGFAVRRCTAEFIAPAQLDDLLEVRTTVGRIGGASLEMTQRIFRIASGGFDDPAPRGDSRAAAARPVCDLALRLACIDGRGRAARFPPHLRGALAGAIGRATSKDTD